MTPDALVNNGHAAAQGPAVVPLLHCRDTLVTYSALPHRIQFPVGRLHDENLWLTAGLVAPKFLLLPFMKVSAISHLMVGQAGARPIEEISILRGPVEHLPYRVSRA